MSSRIVYAAVGFAICVAVFVAWRAAGGKHTAPSGDTAEPGAPEAVAAPAASEAPGCPDYFGPLREGAWRRYSIQVDQGLEGTLVSHVVSERREGGQTVVEWFHEMELEGRGDASWTSTMTCDARGAEEPWADLILQMAQVHQSDGGWRWPDSLSPGDEFGGRRVFNNSRGRLHVQRSHRVSERETVEVGPDRTEATRVDVVEEVRWGDRTETTNGTLWIADDLGLVRSRQRGGAVELRLVEWHG